MTEAYSESSAYVAGLTLPVDTELATMATLAPVLKRIADRTKFLLSRLNGAEAADRVHLPLAMTMIDGTITSRFTYGDDTANTTAPRWVQSNVTDQGFLKWQIVLPKGVTKIQGVRAVIDGNIAGGGHAGLPANLPIVRLLRRDLTAGGTGAVTEVDNETDAPASLAAYEVVHTFGKTNLNHSVLADNLYFAVFQGEQGANALSQELGLYDMYVLVDP